MQPVTFTAYAVPATAYLPSPVEAVTEQEDHTFVVSRDTSDRVVDNWNCWGRGQDTIGNGAREIAQGTALAEWARLIYGTDPNRPTSLIQFVEGVCQNACNRLLVLADKDVSRAGANWLTTLMYGKYGYHLAEFVETVKSTAAAVNAKEPGAISASELQTVLDHIATDPSDELRSLEEHFRSALSSLVSPLDEGKQAQLLAIYRSFQIDRQAVFGEYWPRSAPSQDFQVAYAKALLPALEKCLKECEPILGVNLTASIPYVLKLQ